MERNNQLTALDEYIKKMYTNILLLIPGACLMAGLLYTFEKAIGWFPTVHWMALVIFDLTCVIYLIISIYFIKTGFTPEGEVRPDKLKSAKIFICLLMLIQYNFILYMIPLENFWAYIFFFVTCGSFLLDYKLVAVTDIEIFLSLVVSWFVAGSHTMPVKNELFLPGMLNKVVCLILSMTGIFMLTYFVNRFLVNAKKDEMQKNNERVTNVLDSVQRLSENLGNAGEVLFGVSQNEDTSMRKLSETSETMLSGNTSLAQKSGDSIENLTELQKWEKIMDGHVSNVKKNSDELLKKSGDSEEQLQVLKEVNAEVTGSMQKTNEVAKKLSDAVKEIGLTINIIDEISSSTNLLALNASIEAARAGEAGKGFAVVATEVGNLANNTKDSLNQVGTIIAQVQENVAEMTHYVEQNSEKLNTQNEFLEKLFVAIQEMVQIIHTSIEGIASMGEAHGMQADVITNTVRINEEIAESIRQENEGFANISSMVESTMSDVGRVTEQVNVLNEMIERMNQLLEQR